MNAGGVDKACKSRELYLTVFGMEIRMSNIEIRNNDQNPNYKNSKQFSVVFRISDFEFRVFARSVARCG